MTQNSRTQEPSQDKFSQEKIAYLAQLQGVINRMASTSATCKGFSATIVAGTVAITLDIDSINRTLAYFTAGFLVLISMFYDIYYYSLELRYRDAYEGVRRDSRPIDFSMEVPKAHSHLIRRAVNSKSIWIFYLALYICYAIIATVITC